MTKTTLLSLAALVVAALALVAALRQGGRVAELEARLEASAPAPPPGPQAARPAVDSGRAEGLEALEARLASLQGRVVALEGAGGRPPAAGGGASPGGQAPDPEEVILGVLDSDNPEVRARLKGVIAEQERELRQEHMEEMQAHLAERSREQVAALAKEQELDEAQVSFINTRLDQERDKLRDLFSQARGPGDFVGMRDRVRTVRAETDAAVREQLDDTQYGAYRAMREQEHGPFGGGRPWRR